MSLVVHNNIGFPLSDSRIINQSQILTVGTSNSSSSTALFPREEEANSSISTNFNNENTISQQTASTSSSSSSSKKWSSYEKNSRNLNYNNTFAPQYQEHYGGSSSSTAGVSINNDFDNINYEVNNSYSGSSMQGNYINSQKSSSNCYTQDSNSLKTSFSYDLMTYTSSSSTSVPSNNIKFYKTGSYITENNNFNGNSGCFNNQYINSSRPSSVKDDSSLLFMSSNRCAHNIASPVFRTAESYTSVNSHKSNNSAYSNSQSSTNSTTNGGSNVKINKMNKSVDHRGKPTNHDSEGNDKFLKNNSYSSTFTSTVNTSISVASPSFSSSSMVVSGLSSSTRIVSRNPSYQSIFLNNNRASNMDLLFQFIFNGLAVIFSVLFGFFKYIKDSMMKKSRERRRNIVEEHEFIEVSVTTNSTTLNNNDFNSNNNMTDNYSSFYNHVNNKMNVTTTSAERDSKNESQCAAVVNTQQQQQRNIIIQESKEDSLSNAGYKGDNNNIRVRSFPLDDNNKNSSVSSSKNNERYIIPTTQNNKEDYRCQNRNFTERRLDENSISSKMPCENIAKPNNNRKYFKSTTKSNKLSSFFKPLFTILSLTLLPLIDAFVLVSNTGEIKMLGSLDIDPQGQFVDNKSSQAGIRFKFKGVREWNFHMQDWAVPVHEEALLISRDITDTDYKTYIGMSRDPHEIFLVSQVSIKESVSFGAQLSVTERAYLMGIGTSIGSSQPEEDPAYTTVSNKLSVQGEVRFGEELSIFHRVRRIFHKYQWEIFTMQTLIGVR